MVFLKLLATGGRRIGGPKRTAWRTCVETAVPLDVKPLRSPKKWLWTPLKARKVVEQWNTSQPPSSVNWVSRLAISHASDFIRRRYVYHSPHPPLSFTSSPQPVPSPIKNSPSSFYHPPHPAVHASGCSPNSSTGPRSRPPGDPHAAPGPAGSGRRPSTPAAYRSGALVPGTGGLDLGRTSSKMCGRWLFWLGVRSFALGFCQ